MNYSLKDHYSNRCEAFQIKLNQTKTHSRNLSLWRLLVFILAIILLIIFAQHRSSEGMFLTIFISVTVFLLLVKKHTEALSRKKLLEAYVQINQNELSALDGNLSFNDDGLSYLKSQHRYAEDLDIFGEGSLLQYINRSATRIGNDRLALMMAQPEMNSEEILKAQALVLELSQMSDWRQDFQALGLSHSENIDDDQKIVDWSKKEPLFARNIFPVLSIIIPILSFTMVFLLAFDVVSVQQFLLYLIIPWGISGFSIAKVNTRHMMVSRTSKMLEKFAKLLQLIEKMEVKSGKLSSLNTALEADKQSAGLKLKKLASILTALDNRLNFVSWGILNGLLLWDILQMLRLEKWQLKYKDDVAVWFDIISGLDAYNSIATFAFNHPDFIFPDIKNHPIYLKAESLGHPLIPNNKRLCNNFDLQNGEFIIITGANMAGKSTFLRTIGINLILGMMGAPVCAKEMSFSPITVFTSIRTSDSLHKNESYFYAELKRLKAIIDELKSGTDLFIILDEILKGTNSKDKHAGSEALLNQLLSLNATGIVATHDVALGKLEASFPHNIRNLCFEVDIERGQLFFDYKIKKGVSKNMNATLLMRQMGITI
ncbi:MAG: hypothetical protein K9G76_08470 [Bacteroidales bacterium]|nr:hypothetical protein [Bacteroidales bacterium]MCF8403480.1 hypothetical protein [Bacteroidales bacterium]